MVDNIEELLDVYHELHKFRHEMLLVLEKTRRKNTLFHLIQCFKQLAYISEGNEMCSGRAMKKELHG